MSSILKALKKLEDEKATRRPEMLKIDSDILRPSDAKPRFSPFSTVLLAMLVFIGGSVATYFIMTQMLPPLRASGTQPATGTQRQQPAAPHRTGSTPSAMSTGILPAEVVVVPTAPSTRKKTLLKRPATSQTVLRGVDLKSTAAALSTDPPASQQELPSAAVPDSPAAGVAVPHLRINGIAFQKGSADNKALVNGVPVSSGSTVEGATVEEILNDRVRFSYHGEKIEIPLGQSNRQGEVSAR